MKGLKCLIIDDDILTTDLVVHYADKCEAIEFCLASNDPIEGLKLLNNSHFDLLFLDFNMPRINGQQLLDIKNDSSRVIMITSTKDFAAASYQYDEIVDYLVKPVEYEHFNRSVQRVMSKLVHHVTPQREQEVIMVKDGNNFTPIKLAELLYLKSESNYIVLYTNHQRVMTLATLKDMLDRLPSNFIQCHRSYIINTAKIDSLNMEEIVIGETIIPVSGAFRQDIKDFIGKHLG